MSATNCKKYLILFWCKEKKFQVISLNKGETDFHSDWNSEDTFVLTAETLSDDVNIKLVPMVVVHMKGGGTRGSVGFFKYDLQ